MIVASIIALLAVIAIPGYLRARSRSQATTLLNSLRLLDAAKDQYVLENNKVSVSPETSDLKGYFKPDSALYNSMATIGNSTSFEDSKIQSATFYINGSDILPSIDTGNAFSDVVDPSFWSPYSVN